MLELRGLTHRFGTRVALDGLDLTARPGRLLGFVGPNGAGKTTTMRVVLGVLRADAGAATWRGAPITGDVRARFGAMPEERGLYPKMRVLDQVAYFARLHGLPADRARAAARAQLERLGLGERLADRTEALSLGNQQRVQLAVALVHEPELLVLDEPFSGLDPMGADVMAGVLRERAGRGVPVVFSSHQLELVERLCDDVAIVRDGRIVAAGTVAELRAQRAGRRWRVEVEGDTGPVRAWLPAGARDEGGGIVALDEGVDEQALLDAARAAGRVRRFGPHEPPLAELFREVATAPVEAPAA